jgi:hypothetical protein
MDRRGLVMTQRGTGMELGLPSVDLSRSGVTCRLVPVGLRERLDGASAGSSSALLSVLGALHRSLDSVGCVIGDEDLSMILRPRNRASAVSTDPSQHSFRSRGERS